VTSKNENGETQSVMWEFHLKDFEELKFEVVSSYRKPEYSIAGFYLESDYIEVLEEFIIKEFETYKASDPEFKPGKWHEYTNKEELKKTAEYFLEYLDFINNHELEYYFINFYFSNPNLNSYKSSISFNTGVESGKLIPVRYVQDEGYFRYDDFIESMLKRYDSAFGEESDY